MKKKVIIISIIVVIILALLAIFIVKPWLEASNEYKTITSKIKKENKKLEDSIGNLDKYINSSKKTYDENIPSEAKKVKKTAQQKMIIIEKKPFLTSEIKKANKKMDKNPDLSKEINSVNEMAKKYDISIKQMEKFNNPSEDYIKKRIASVETITNFAAVTEDNDPNGKLNKAGGYTSTVYFESSLVNQSEFDTNDVIEKGTACGGSIEVYSTEEDAKKRDTYLASFDGSILSNGKHTVVGTVVIRVSDEMGASKQEELTQKIKDAIAKLD